MAAERATKNEQSFTNENNKKAEMRKLLATSSASADERRCD